MLKGNKLAVYTHDYVKQVLTAAQDGKYALPAINVSNLDTAIAAMNGLEQAGSPGFVQVSIGAAEHCMRYHSRRILNCLSEDGEKSTIAFPCLVKSMISGCSCEKPSDNHSIP